MPLRKIPTLKIETAPKVVFITLLAASLLVLFQNCGQPFETSKTFLASNSALAIPKYAVDVTSNQKVISNVPSQQLSFAVEPSHASEVMEFFCQLDSSTLAKCSSPYNAQDLGEGRHQVRIEGRNKSGVAIATGSYEFVVDKTAPVLMFSQGPGDISGSASVSFALSVQDSLSGVSKTECSLDGQSFASTESSFNVGPLAEGAHTLRCQATDGALNTANLIQKSWLTSLSSPSLTLENGLVLFSGTSNAVRFTTASTTNSAVTVTCALDGKTASVCRTGETFSNLAAGVHAVVLTAKDTLGRTSNATYSWTVDLTAPTVAVTTNLGKYTSLTSIPLTFNASDGTGSGVSSCECGRIIGATEPVFAACSSPYALPAAVEGELKAVVRCRDAIGNVSLNAPFQVLVDRTAPILTYKTTAVALSTNTSSTFTLSAVETVANPVRYQGSLNGAAYVDVPATYSLNVTEGRYSLAMRAVDDAGNASVVQTFTWAVDTSPPTAPSLVRIDRNDPPILIWQPSTDLGSGIDYYEVKAGFSEGANDLFDTVRSTTSAYNVPYNVYIQSAPTYENRFDGRVVYITVRSVDRIGNRSAWASSGPTSAGFNGTFPMGFGCGTLNSGCHRVQKLVTTAENLNAGILQTESYIVIPANQRIRIERDFQGENFETVIKKTPGALRSECKLDGVPFTCEMVVDGSVVPDLAEETPRSLEVQIFYNDQPFFQSKTTIEVSSRSFFPNSYETLDHVGTIALRDIGAGGFSKTEQLWVAADKRVIMSLFCMDYGPKYTKQARAIAGVNSVLSFKSSQNVWGTCDTRIYADTNSRVYLGSGIVDELNVAPGSKIFVRTGFSATEIKKLNRLTTPVGDVNSCPFSVTGQCPADTVTYR